MSLPTGVDQECVALCSAINMLPGLTIVESCCGHGERPFKIWVNAANVSNLAPLCYFLDSCHSGLLGWKVIVQSDCSMARPTFKVEGPVSAFEDAAAIAKLITDWVREEEVLASTGCSSEHSQVTVDYIGISAYNEKVLVGYEPPFPGNEGYWYVAGDSLVRAYLCRNIMDDDLLAKEDRFATLEEAREAGVRYIKGTGGSVY